ncbi:hypothetical protein E2562_034904 [Oryza meyeriana var. granulata]|uniref:Uncharacterized protein n=1 Tax=Oryza meyeriana var. granulata TaxID=110450 RepID=A0A6G1E7H7_9ORYZ|nr:hypothetical protein E2562_034904 [Oryza meyeriana var. granulata]
MFAKKIQAEIPVVGRYGARGSPEPVDEVSNYDDEAAQMRRAGAAVGWLSGADLAEGAQRGRRKTEMGSSSTRSRRGVAVGGGSCRRSSGGPEEDGDGELKHPEPPWGGCRGQILPEELRGAEEDGDGELERVW